MEQKTTQPGIVRSESGALLNKDTASLRKYKLNKKMNRRIQDLENRIDFLEEKVTTILEILNEKIDSP